MNDLQIFWQKLHQNLNILRQRQARYSGNTPPELLEQIEEYEKAIFLTRQRLDSMMSIEEWREALKPLRLVNIPIQGADDQAAAETQVTQPQPTGEAVSPTEPQYNLANIRELLIKGFSDTDLRNFCFDQLEFREVYDQLAEQTGKEQIIDLMLEHTDQHLLFEPLLAWAKERNPVRFRRHQPYIVVPRRPADH